MMNSNGIEDEEVNFGKLMIGSDGLKGEEVDFSQLKGKIIVKILGLKKESRWILFVCDDGSEYCLQHHQDCCEYVRIEDIVGDPIDLIGTPILDCYEGSGPTVEYEDNVDDFTGGMWTFYNIGTFKGYVTLRWLGESNGCYSEKACFEKIKSPTEKNKN